MIFKRLKLLRKLAKYQTYIQIGIVLRTSMIFFYLGFLSQTFTNHRTAGEGGGHFFNSPLPLPPASQKVYRELGLESVQPRRWYVKFCSFYKICKTTSLDIFPI